MVGLIELLFVLLLVIGWGVTELRSLRRLPKSPPPRKPPPPRDPPA